MQSIGFLGPALFLTLLSKVQTPAMGHGRVVHGMQSGLMHFRNTIRVDLYVASSFVFGDMAYWCYCPISWQGSDAFSQSGLYSNHQDIGPCYAVMT